ncbi:MAG: alpha/beta hydrolase [Tenericutes bacterium]|nr:alpha/beta hydrolase [Mycoplasmatota bacterium]
MIERINIEKLNMKGCQYIQVYLPEGYYSSSRNFDVIYMHDGHNLFDINTSAFGMVWGIDKILGKREKEKKKTYIIIGIECPSMERYSIYSPWNCSFKNDYSVSLYDNLGGKGKEYAEWIIEKLIPMVENRYRTSNQRYMAGSSMGGITTLYTGITYSNIFKGIGLFSPAIWFSKPEMIEFVKSFTKMNASIYLDIGCKETSNEDIKNFKEIYLEDAREMKELLVQKELKNMKYFEDSEGQHNELFWSKRFNYFLDFIETL